MAFVQYFEAIPRKCYVDNICTTVIRSSKKYIKMLIMMVMMVMVICSTFAIARSWNSVLWSFAQKSLS